MVRMVKESCVYLYLNFSCPEKKVESEPCKLVFICRHIAGGRSTRMPFLALARCSFLPLKPSHLSTTLPNKRIHLAARSLELETRHGSDA